MKTLKMLLAILSPSERRHVMVLLLMILLMALFDMLGVASIMPFMAVLATPELIETNPLLDAVYKYSHSFGINTPERFLFALGVFTFLLLVSSLIFKGFATYMQLYFGQMREHSIGKRLVEGYLNQPYSWFLSRNSADLGKTILSEVTTVVGQSLKPLLYLIAHGTVASALLALLVFMDPELALIVALSLGITYFLIFKISSGLLKRIGAERVIANEERFTAVSEAFGAVKHVKLAGIENIFVERFSAASQTYARHQAKAQTLSILPRFAIEAVAFGGIIILILFLMIVKGSFASALPIIALYAFAGYRLIPAIHQLYSNLVFLRFSSTALELMHEELMNLKQLNSISSSNLHQGIDLNESINLNKISFRYPNADSLSLKDISLRIEAKSTVGFMGSSGSGKTTLVDLVLGLLDAYEGTITVDGQAISNNKRGWQNIIGYVPQHIYLIDDSVIANIAFGVEPEKIDLDAVERAAKIANLHDFVIKDLPQGYASIVGEHGIRLSGGQRQRIGIARAFYNKPKVIVFDEATSALDNLTEQAVMDAISNAGKDLTIILIAHRLDTLKACDTIFHLEGGRLKTQGTFDELYHTDEVFRAMASSINN